MSNGLFSLIFIFQPPIGSLLIDPRYHTYEEMVQEIDSIATLYPQIVKLETLGFSTRISSEILRDKDI